MCKTTAAETSSDRKDLSARIGAATTNPGMRRGKRDKEGKFVPPTKKPGRSRIKKKSKSLQKHGSDGKSGGIEALIPSLIGVVILVVSAMAKLGFRGRASVAGVDLGTTNSVICVQQPSKTVGEIVCMPDPNSGSPIIPSVISFLEHPDRTGRNDKKVPLLDPHPSQVVVGREAKHRIDTHPHHTLYNAKRVLGRSFTDDAVRDLRNEVEFEIIREIEESDLDSTSDRGGVMFRVPHHHNSELSSILLKPQQVGSYIVHHLIEITKLNLGHENVKAAVIAVPAKFNSYQRQMTVEAFKIAGVTVSRILEEPTAAALAYGLDKKENVDYILVYDFGGGTLDVSILHVSNDGFVDVMGSDGDDRLGGADFDAAVAHFLLRNQGGQDVVDRVAKILGQFEIQFQVSDSGDVEEALDEACPVLRNVSLCTVSSFHTLGEKMKIELSSYPNENVEVRAECLSPPIQSSMPATLTDFCESLRSYPLSLTSLQYNDLARPLFDRSKLPIERLLDDLGLRKEEIDEVVMVGGTTRMPQIRELVKEVLVMETLNTHIDPDLTVAYGAASVID